MDTIYRLTGFGFVVYSYLNYGCSAFAIPTLLVAIFFAILSINPKITLDKK